MQEVINYGSVNELETKPRSTIWVFQDGPKLTKVVHDGSTSKQMVSCFSEKTVMWQQFFYINVKQSFRWNKKKKQAPSDHFILTGKCHTFRLTTV